MAVHPARSSRCVRRIMARLLTELPRPGLRPAGGLSSRLGCQVLGHREPVAVVRPLGTGRQMRFSSSDTEALDYDDPGHYATLGLGTSASPKAITEAWTRLNLDLHPDITGRKSRADTDKLLKVS